MLIFSERYRLALYNHDLVILDIESDAFSVISDVTENISYSSEYMELIHFLADRFLCYSVPELLPSESNYGSFLEIRWLRPLSDYTCKGLLHRLQSYLVIRKCKRLVDKGGYSEIVHEIDRIKKRTRAKAVENQSARYEHSRVSKAISFVNLSFNMFTIENPCLVYSVALASCLLTDGVEARIVIGVRTAPFFSHAWVEVDGKVVGDDPELRSKLCVIMEI
ncbi:lasso peptide biosynthesis B2 protein [Cronobacter dublinensis]|uniref:lasso peptide biosynthesis B2 protein n=1 Tax=Cronobacter dublinensis TaxID=413497 RepID=UPI00300E168A